MTGDSRQRGVQIARRQQSGLQYLVENPQQPVAFDRFRYGEFAQRPVSAHEDVISLLRESKGKASGTDSAAARAM